jgi:hypothetical protein
MPDRGADAETFDLPTAGSRGRSKGVVLEETALAWHGSNGLCNRSFDEIASIELEADPGGDVPYARCDIYFADGEHLKLEITNDARHAMEIEAFRAFIFLFFEMLGPAQRTRIMFREGSGPIKRMAAIIFSAAGVIAFIGVIIWLIVSGDYMEDNQYLLFPLAFFFVVVLSAMFVISLKSGLKPFDPTNVPPHALPAVPRKRQPAK